MPPQPIPLNQLFAERVERRGSDECWLWIGTLRPDGYGCTKSSGKIWLAHRLAYELLVGPIPEGMTLDHLCRNRSCVNPAHLALVTRAENTRRALVLRTSNHQRDKTRCPSGHTYTEENTMFKKNTRFRFCRTCHQTRSREYMRKRRARLREAGPSA